ncbi:GMC oxidoreductase [Amaricoccus sp.]|uniref:GMC oxidoreductase n=1 Tax=Amaricoccus sp. TaxID=1872485 RepID=UPI00260E0BFC|nr:GMC family oxidoreductase [Amaricoccus sp.]HRO12191.1 GMC family oxidoreductase [Amaricoccus sp.]
MIADASSMDRSAFEREFDVCVVGSGPAGITLARRLAAKGARVALMEAGGLEYSDESQDAYRGTNIGMEYFDLDVCRLRYFGGTSNHWGGWTRALEAVDFLPKSYAPLTGWPIGQIDLDPYRTEADAILDVPSATEAPDLPVRQKGYDFHRFQFRFSPPTRFAEKYLGEIEASEAITLVVNANLVDLRLDEGLGRVAGAVFRGYAPADPGFTIRARAYALCCGGIENARLLLNFTSQVPEGVGNRGGWVGRCFADHPHFLIAECVLRVLVREREFYAPTELFMTEHACLNFGLRLEPRWIWPYELPALAREDMPPEEFNILLERLVRDPFVDRALTDRLVLPQPTGQTGVLRIAQEALPNPESRVRLGEERDAFGLRRVAMDWRLSEIDVHTMRTAAMAFGAHMADTEIGRAQVGDWLLADPPRFPGVLDDEVGGKHHMGTTRMAADPGKGVVDADCRVHEVENLYIGGSSVFASTGHCNPTYTLTQLALRLGDHLAARLAG